MELKKNSYNNNTTYTFKDGLPLGKEEVASMIFLDYSRVNYSNLARVIVCLTDNTWQCIGPVMVMYPSEKGRTKFPCTSGRTALGEQLREAMTKLGNVEGENRLVNRISIG